MVINRVVYFESEALKMNDHTPVRWFFNARAGREREILKGVFGIAWRVAWRLFGKPWGCP